jgi:hypothetical protein
MGANGPAGPQGATGPQGPAGITQAVFANAFGPNGGGVASTTDFIGPIASVTVGANQRVAITASKALGSAAVGGANGLNLFVCVRPTAGTITAIGAGMFGMTVVQNERKLFTVPGISGPLAAGTYDVGMCGSAATPADWNNNEYGYVMAFVIQ